MIWSATSVSQIMTGYVNKSKARSRLSKDHPPRATQKSLKKKNPRQLLKLLPSCGNIQIK